MSIIKAREVREKLTGKVDPVLLHTLEAIVEQMMMQREQLMEQAVILDKCLDIINNTHMVMDNMKSTVDKMKSKELAEGEQTITPTH